MKNFTLFLMIIAGILFSSHAIGADRVVVIPLNTTKKLMNVVTVSAKGGDFTDPVMAINSITNATADNPYLVFIGPGVYTIIQTFAMKPFVNIAGAGQDATTLTGAISSNDPETSAIVTGANNATISNLTIENKGLAGYSIALYNNNSSPVIHEVTVTASRGTYIYGVLNTNSSSPNMTDVVATATSRGIESYGVYNSFSSPKMMNVAATGSGEFASYGVYNSSSSPSMTYVTATAFGNGYYNVGVYNSSSSPSLYNVTATAFEGSLKGPQPEETKSYAVYNTSSTVIIRHCTLKGDISANATSAGIYVNGGTTRVMQSSIIGGVDFISGTLTCVNSDDGVATALICGYQ